MDVMSNTRVPPPIPWPEAGSLDPSRPRVRHTRMRGWHTMAADLDRAHADRL